MQTGEEKRILPLLVTHHFFQHRAKYCLISGSRSSTVLSGDVGKGVSSRHRNRHDHESS